MSRRLRFLTLGVRAAPLPSVVFVALLAAGGCEEQKNVYAPPPPPEVTVAEPVRRPVTDYLEITGNTQAVESVELKARIEGFLASVNFKDGDIVRKGQLLFVIEPAPYEARLRLAEASVNEAGAELARAEEEYARQLRLIKQAATAQAEVEKWRAQRDAAKAAVDEARANAEINRINLSYTHVTAPFDGRIGRRLVDPGNLVGSGGQATKLAVIERLDPIYAYFNVNERDVLELKERQRAKGSPDYRERAVPIFLGLQTDQNYPLEGQIDFAAVGVDPGSGTLQVRGVFANPKNVLLPGLFVRLRVPLEQREDALLVSERALGVDQGGPYVLVVNAGDVVEQRSVRTGALVEGLRVIEEGLKPDDRVVVNGIQRARQGAKVTPVRAGETAGASAPPPRT